MGKVSARYFLQQRDTLEKGEAPTDAMIASMNSLMRREQDTFFKEFEIDTLRPDAHRDEPGKTPRVFVLKDGKPSTLTESGIKPGSREFWEAAMKGQLFGYQLGKKDPVQIQAWMGQAGLQCAVSAPLTPGKEAGFPREPAKPKPPKEPERPEKPIKPEEPQPVAEPGKEPPRPGFFTRLGAFFGNKASKNRIAAHTAWTEQSAAHRKYQDDMTAYSKLLKAYESDLEDYARHTGQYHASVIAKKIIDRANVGKMEAYELEHAAWEKEKANKDQLSKAREQSAQAIAGAFGQTRGDDVLAAEKEEAKEQKKLYDATIDQLKIEQSIENMMTMYGSRPHAKDSFITEGTYAAKDIEQLSQISLEGLRVGEQPVTDEDFATLAMFSVVTPENGRKLAAESSPPIVDYPGTVKAFEELGYTEQELGEVLANQFIGVVTTDTLRANNPRNPMSTYFGSCVEPARLNARQALAEYQKGNRQPLADIISRGMEYTDQTARLTENMDGTTSALLRMASHMADMMERDPQLREMAAASFAQREQAMCTRHKDFAPPRTMDDLIQNVRAHEKFSEVRQRSAEAREKLLNAQSGRAALSEQEKKECLRDMMKCDLVSGMYKTRTSRLSNEAMDALAPVADKIDKYKTHETLSMLCQTYDAILRTRYMKKSTEKNPAALDIFNDPHILKSMDKKLDKLIEQEIHKEGGSLDLMCGKVLNEVDRTYSGESLADAIQKLAAPAAGKGPVNSPVKDKTIGGPEHKQEQPEKGR